MKEAEVKILDVSHKNLEPKLLSLGAKKIFDGELDAFFFDTEDSKIRNSNETLRLRKVGDRSFMAHKKKISSKKVKIKDETEIEVSNFNDAKKLILSLGFKEFDNVKKRRVSYKINNIRFEFDIHQDKYSFIPEFMEIEANNIDEIFKYAKLLGFSKKDCKPWTKKDLIKHYS